jgi:predicted NBD/HSP70 family sugar kinase
VRANLATVLGLLHDDGPASRAELARRTGLTKATLSSLVAELSALGLVDEEPAPAVRDRAVGRPARPVRVSSARALALGLHLDVRSASAVLLDLTGAVVAQQRATIEPRNREPTAALDELAALGATVVRAGRGRGRSVVGVGLAAPGLVDPRDGSLHVAPNLGWVDWPLATELEASLRRHRLPTAVVVVDNEANMAALAELPALRPDGVTSFLAVSANVGVGAGVVLDGRLFRGTHGFGGELGHVVVAPGGRRCRCGNRGCLETIAGADRFRRAAGLRPSATPRETAWLDRAVVRAGAGDRRVTAAVEEVGAALADALTAACNLFDPQAVVLGGYLGALAPWLAAPLAEQLHKRVLGARWAPVSVRAATWGPSAPAVGAARAGFAALLADPAGTLARAPSGRRPRAR